ncbi:hypothetical protein HGB07_07095 [Candidatus Roizmanbacteria bacterium]|nr:hypothetical protein [Candidatus Roizmanbacteria bacterium]
MKSLLLNPAINIIVTQIVVMWSLILSHYSDKKYVKIVTFFTAVPLTLYAIIIGVNESNLNQDYSQNMSALVKRIEKKAINTERRLDSINLDLDQVSLSVQKIDYVVKDVSQMVAVAKNLRQSLSALDANLIKQTDKSLNEIQRSSSTNAKAMQQIDQKNAQLLNSLERQRAEQAMRSQQEMLQRQQQDMMSQQQQMMLQQQQNLMLRGLMR